VYGLGREYVRMGHNVRVVTMSYKGLPAVEQVDGMHVYRVKGPRLSKIKCTSIEMMPYLLGAFSMVRRLHKVKPFDVIHAHFIFPDGVIASRLGKRLGIPFVITAHGSDVPGYNPARFRILHRLLLPLWRRVVKRAEAVICPSSFLQELVKEKMPDADMLHVIPNGISRNKFSAGRRKKKVILMASRVLERKGFQHCLEALKGLDTVYKVHIVGDGPYLGQLKKQAQMQNLPVIFHGHLDNNSQELKILFETARIFVFTSSMENCPIVLLEAMLAGASIETSDGSGCAEAAGNTALLVPHGAADKIRKALLYYINNPGKAEIYGRKARSRVERKYTWEKVAPANISVLSKAVQAFGGKFTRP